MSFNPYASPQLDPESASPAPPGRGPRAETLALGALFAAMYFIQGIAEPTQGLIAQPVKSLLDLWGLSVTQISVFAFVIAAPWTIKPLFGLLSDFVPLLGSRRKYYLVLCNILVIGGLLWLFCTPLTANSAWLLCLVLLAPTAAVAFSDVLVDSLMIEKGQPRGITGTLQGVQWAAMYAAAIVTGTLGGWLSQHELQRWGFLICAAVTLPALVLSVFCVHEERATPRQTFRDALAGLWQAAQSPALWAVAAFFFLWNFNPFSATVLQLHMTKRMGFTEQFYGDTVSLNALASVAASVLYIFYCRRLSRTALVHVSIALGVVSTLGYWWLRDELSAVIVNLAVGFTYMTALLIQLDLAAQACPPRAAGTVFASLMALSNLSVTSSEALGGWLYDWIAARYDYTIAFQFLVAFGAGCTALCWLLVPFLRKPRLV